MRAHYFQHVPFEGLGCIEAILQERGALVTSTQFFDLKPLPNPDDIDILIVMGGPMSVHDSIQYPWLLTEMDYIKSWLKTGKPLLGICLGAQLIASALGASVHANLETEIGWYPIENSGVDSSLFFQFPPSVDVFHWHGETFDLPRGATRLATSAACENQAFQIGRSVVGLQFHLEMTPETARTIVNDCGDELVAGTYIQSKKEIIQANSNFYEEANRLMVSLLDYLIVRS